MAARGERRVKRSISSITILMLITQSEGRNVSASLYMYIVRIDLGSSMMTKGYVVNI
jgi:hypothetical protein